MKYDLESAKDFLEYYLKTNIDIEEIGYESLEFMSNEIDEELLPDGLLLPSKIMSHGYSYNDYYLYYINEVSTDKNIIIGLLKGWELIYYKLGSSNHEPYN